MRISIDSVDIQESPSYEGTDCDGLPITLWHYFLEATDHEGNKWGHDHSFPATRYGQSEAIGFAGKVRDHGSISTGHWVQDDIWAQYRTPQTWAEEKAEYFERLAS